MPALTKHTWAWGVLLAGGLLTLGLARFFLLIITVRGRSMAPTLAPGDRVLVWRHWPARYLRRHQIVIVARPRHDTAPRFPGAYFIKRVVGLPGETLETHLSELPARWRPRLRAHHDAQGKRVWRIPAGHVFVRGDGVGTDSLVWGPVPRRAIASVMVARLPRREHRTKALLPGGGY